MRGRALSSLALLTSAPLPSLQTVREGAGLSPDADHLRNLGLCYFTKVCEILTECISLPIFRHIHLFKNNNN